MVLKNIDDKSKEISTLRVLLSRSSSEAQKKLIDADLRKLEKGYAAEKENAYYLDFFVKDLKRIILLHDIRLEYDGQIAQFDHILISLTGIEILESKSSSGTLSIYRDNSIVIRKGKNTYTLPNPIEQNKRHKKVLKKVLANKLNVPARLKLLGGIAINPAVLIHPKTNVTNAILPEGYYRADAFMSNRIKEIESWSPTGIAKTIKDASRLISLDLIHEIADLLISSHMPLFFDYTKKYKIGTESYERFKRPAAKEQIPGKKCPECEDGTLVQRVGKPNKDSMLNVFLGCSNFPDCRHTENIESKECPKCGSTLVIRTPKKGSIFWGCSDYPHCRFTENIT